MGADVRQALISAFSEEGLVLDRQALALLVEHLVQGGHDSGEELQQGIAKLLGSIGAGGCQLKRAVRHEGCCSFRVSRPSRLRWCAAGTEATVTAVEAGSILQKCAGQQKASAACVQVISAFAAPRVKYDPIRNAFYKPPGKATLHGLAQVLTTLRAELMARISAMKSATAETPAYVCAVSAPYTCHRTHLGWTRPGMLLV